VRILDLDGLPAQHDRAQWPELRARLSARFKERTRDEWAAAFEGTDACVAPVLSWREAATHPHIAGRQTLVERDGVLQPAPAPRFSRTTTSLASPAQAPGSDTEAVFADWLG